MVDHVPFGNNLLVNQCGEGVHHLLAGKGGGNLLDIGINPFDANAVGLFVGEFLGHGAEHDAGGTGGIIPDVLREMFGASGDDFIHGIVDIVDQGIVALFFFVEMVDD